MGAASPDLAPGRRPGVGHPVAPAPRRVPSRPSHWEQYLLCIGFHLLIPLLPLGSEMALARTVSATSLHLVASTYATSVGVSSRTALGFGFGRLVSMPFAIFFGVGAAESLPPNHLGILEARWLPLVVIAGIFGVHTLERYNRHVVDRLPCWEFMRRADA